ncbi:MAG: NADH-quinone oxidoreductase subunit A [bacterium]
MPYSTLSTIEKLLEQFSTPLAGKAAYSPVIMMILLSGGIGLSMLLIGWLIRPDRPNKQKLSPYECGIEPTGDAFTRVIPRYYIYAILFIVFDVEALFLLPWAIVFSRIGMFAFIEMVIFIVILVVGLIYAWAKGALDWYY